MASRDKTSQDSMTGMAAGRMAEKAGDTRTEAPVERKTYPYERINSLIDSIPSAEGISVLGPIKEAAKGLNSILAISSGDYMGDTEGMVKATVDAGIGAGALGVGRAAVKTGVKNLPNQTSIFAAVDEKGLPAAQQTSQRKFDTVNPYSIPQPGYMQRTSGAHTTLDGNEAYTVGAYFNEDVGPNERREAERWLRTGTVRNAAGQLMREIDDSLATYSPPEITNGEGGAYMRDVLQHDELYRQYPEVADIPVLYKRDPLDGTYGYYDPVNKGIVINTYRLDPNDATKMKKMMLHEMQHVVSDIDASKGFKPGLGASPNQAGTQRLMDILANAKKWRGVKIKDLKGFNPTQIKYVKDMVATYNLMDQLLKNATGFDTDQFVSVIDEVAKRNPNGASGDQAFRDATQDKFALSTRAVNNLFSAFNFKVYERSLGEITAREAEIRSEMSPLERQWKYPRIFEEESRGKAAIKEDGLK
jgi:hypothetical protein